MRRSATLATGPRSSDCTGGGCSPGRRCGHDRVSRRRWSRARNHSQLAQTDHRPICGDCGHHPQHDRPVDCCYDNPLYTKVDNLTTSQVDDLTHHDRTAAGHHDRTAAGHHDRTADGHHDRTAAGHDDSTTTHRLVRTGIAGGLLATFQKDSAKKVVGVGRSEARERLDPLATCRTMCHHRASVSSDVRGVVMEALAARSESPFALALRVLAARAAQLASVASSRCLANTAGGR